MVIMVIDPSLAHVFVGKRAALNGRLQGTAIARKLQ